MLSNARTTNSLSVVSSNIRYDDPNDGPQSWQHRKAFLGQRLRDLSAHLLATQEGKEEQIRELAEELPHLTLIEQHRHWNPELMYPCLFYDQRKLVLSESGDIWLSRSPLEPGSRSFGSEFARLCTWAIFRPDLLVINVHLDNARFDTREQQIRVLLKEAQTLRLGKGSTLLMGDFNEAPDGPVRRTIEELWPHLRDPWQQLGLQEDSSHHCFGREIDYGSRVGLDIGRARPPSS